MDNSYRGSWEEISHCAEFAKGDTVYGICPNCSAILEESKPDVCSRSLWELILEDKSFSYPDFRGESIAIQDCWRSKEKKDLQEVVRQLLLKMNIKVVELKENHAGTDFCGISLLRPAPSRNLKLAPKRFVENAKRKFLPHSAEEQKAIMERHCAEIPAKKVIAYCHYCAEGLTLGGANVKHLAELLFDPAEWV